MADYKTASRAKAAEELVPGLRAKEIAAGRAKEKDYQKEHTPETTKQIAKRRGTSDGYMPKAKKSHMGVEGHAKMFKTPEHKKAVAKGKSKESGYNLD
jgi:hypothetical protein